MGGLVWLAAYPKSGNTWVRHFLRSLINLSNRPHDSNAMNRLTTGDSARLWYEPFLDKPVKDCSDDELAAVRPRTWSSSRPTTPW